LVTQLPEVRLKRSWIRGCLASRCRNAGCLGAV
jgi:hypothetical protein